MDLKIYNPGNTRPYTTRKTTEAIILHHADATKCTPADIVRWHKARGFNGAGYNFFVAKDGTKYQLRPIGMVGAHTLGGWNSKSIGICAEGNFMVDTMGDAQIKAIAEVIDYCNDWAKTKLSVYRHKAKWPTACPGTNYPFDTILNLSKATANITIAPVPKVEVKVYIRQGDKGKEVGEVQDRLITLGYYKGKKDNDFGPLTLAAVEKFQGDNNLKVDGIVGPLTLTALAKAHVDICPILGTVTASILNVRSGPGTSYKDIGNLSKGEEVKIAKQSGKWYSIYFGEHGGWVSAEYIK